MEDKVFEEGMTVWYQEGGKAKRGKVLGCYPDEEGESWEYDVKDEDGGISQMDEYELFPCAEALVRDIFEDYELGDIDIDFEEDE